MKLKLFFSQARDDQRDYERRFPQKERVRQHRRSSSLGTSDQALESDSHIDDELSHILVTCFTEHQAHALVEDLKSKKNYFGLG